jgi:hypothetical protein
MYPKPINLTFTNSLLVATQAIAAACRFLGLGDLTLINLKNDESGHENGEGGIRQINFLGETHRYGHSPQSIQGRVTVQRDDSILRWVPVVCDVDTTCCRAVGFDCSFDDQGCLQLIMSHSPAALGSHPIR